MSPPEASPGVATPDENSRWWLEAAGKVWGPYPRRRLTTFVGEGRLAASSRVGRAAAGPFAPAAMDPDLSDLFPSDAREPATEPVPQTAEDAADEEAHAASRPLLVFAALQATRVDLFESAVAAQGESVRVAPGLWIVRARCPAASLRNLLSRSLREGDVLWVSELEPARAAWFAVPGDIDRAVRLLLAERTN